VYIGDIGFTTDEYYSSSWCGSASIELYSSITPGEKLRFIFGFPYSLEQLHNKNMAVHLFCMTTGSGVLLFQRSKGCVETVFSRCWTVIDT